MRTIWKNVWIIQTYQLLKKDPTAKIKAKALKQLQAMKVNELVDNKLFHYLKSTDSPAPKFYGQP